MGATALKNETQMIPFTDNPWLEADTTPQANKAIAMVHRAFLRSQELAPRLPGLPLTNFSADLAAIEAAYRADIGAYRRTRALTAVHLPTILELIEALADMPRADNPERYDALLADTRTCLRAAADARAAIETDKLTALEISAATTAARLSDPEDQAQVAEDSIITKSWRSSAALAGRLGGKITDPIRQVSNDASRRLGGGLSYARTTMNNLVEDGVHLLTAPVTTRLSAARSALQSASISAIVGGLVIAVVFPPAVPLALGLSFLETPDLYAEALRNERKTLDQARDAKTRKREEATLASLRALRGESPIIRMETPCLAMTMNLDEGTADGVILAGRHTGQTLGSLSTAELRALTKHAPDDETRQILAGYGKIHAALKQT